MKLAVTIEPAAGPLPGVDYRWDVDTEILTASLREEGGAAGGSGSVEIVGDDGSWLVLDVRAGHISGVEVAVWPSVRTLATLAPPPPVADARVVVPGRGGALAAIEVSTTLGAESDRAERTIHFRVGPRRPARAVRIARDVLIDVDGRDRIAGAWLLNVPPFPTRPPDPTGDASEASEASEATDPAVPVLPSAHPQPPERLVP